MAKPHAITKREVAQFVDAVHVRSDAKHCDGNNRHVMPLNGRVVQHVQVGK